MDINNVISEAMASMLSTLQEGLKSNFPKVAAMVVDFLSSKKERLTYIAQARLNGSIDDNFAVDALKTEVTILKDELLAIGVATESALEDLANKIVTDFTSLLVNTVTNSINNINP